MSESDEEVPLAREYHARASCQDVQVRTTFTESRPVRIESAISLLWSSEAAIWDAEIDRALRGC